MPFAIAKLHRDALRIAAALLSSLRNVSSLRARQRDIEDIEVYDLIECHRFHKGPVYYSSMP